jgi:hypothetical protein
VGYQTPQNKVLRGIKPRRITFKYEYFCKVKTEFKNILGCEFGDYSMWGRFVEKTRGQKSRATVPLKGSSDWCQWIGLKEDIQSWTYENFYTLSLIFDRPKVFSNPL